MNQRVGGVVLLVLALFMLLTAQIAEGPRIAGAAIRAPLPPPPQVGSCMTGLAHIVVSCDLPHEQEVTASWMARDGNEPTGSPFQFCIEAAQVYLGEPAAPANRIWTSPGLHYETQYITAPAADRIQWFGWQACLIQSVYSGGYLGSIRGLPAETDRPSAYGNCAFGNLVPPTLANVNCTEPHEVEILGRASGFVPEDTSLVEYHRPLPQREVLDAQCQRLAADLLKTADPTYDRRLVVEIRSATEEVASIWDVQGLPELFSQVELPILDQAVRGTAQYATCLVRASHLGILTDSLVGNGSRPLPIQ